MKTGRGRLMRCPHCGFDCRFGVGVCQGCGAEVVYGASRKDTSDARAFGILLGLGLAWFFGPTAWWGYLSLAGLGALFGPAFNGHWRHKVRFFRHYEQG